MIDALLATTLLVTATTLPAFPALTNTPVLIAPQSIDLGRVEPGTKSPVTAWLVNTSFEPVRVLSARPSCGCVVMDFEPLELGPLQVAEVRFTINAPAVLGQKKTRFIRFTIEDSSPVRLDVSIESSRPRFDFMRFDPSRVRDRQVIATPQEINELNRLLGEPEISFDVTFELDDQDRVEKIVLVPHRREETAVTAR